MTDTIPTIMRAVVHETFGGPADVLGVKERPVPVPGTGEVLVRTVLSRIHNHDLWTVRGTYGFKPEMPAPSGTEALGVVEALGEGVTHLSVGQRVAGGAFGVWADYYTANAASLVPVPDAMPDEAASQLVSMPFSAISLLHSLDLHQGDWLVQNAANGAVGRMVAQLGAARGINVIGLVRRNSGVEELREQGIERVVATDADDWKDQVAAITGGAPIVAGVESVGGKAAGDIASVLTENATLVILGAIASPTLEIPSGKVIFGQLTIKGFWGSVVSKTMPADTKSQLFGELTARVLDDSLTLPVAEILSFENVRDAVRASNTPGRIGKILLRP